MADVVTMLRIVKARIRVAFVDLPPLLRQIVEHEIARHADLEPLPDAPAAIRTGNVHPPPHALILAADAPDAAAQARRLLDTWPRASVLVFIGRGRAAAMFRLEQRRMELGQLSPSEAAGAIRDSFNEAQALNH